MSSEQEIIVEIDNQIEDLIREINTAPAASQIDLAMELKVIVVEAIAGPFGLSAAMFADVDGGNVTTARNFEKGVTANADDADRYAAYQNAQTSKFDRSDYERSLPRERKAIFQSDQSGFVTDGYTGKPLAKDGQAQRDHVVSAAEIERSAKGHFAQTRGERVATANQEANKVWTHQSINASKGDRDGKVWKDASRRDNPAVTNGQNYAIDDERFDSIYSQAVEAVQEAQNRAVLRKCQQDLLVTGGREAGLLALRQIVGMILKDVAQGLIDDIKLIIREGLASVAQLPALLHARLEITIASITAKWISFMKAGLAAGLSGFLSGLVTLVINTLVTTAARIVTIIREGTLALVRSIKLIASPPPSMSAKDIAAEVLSLLLGALTTSLGLLMEEAVTKMLEGIPILAPFAQELAAVLTAILSGTAGLLTILAFDHIRDTIRYRNRELANRHREHSVTLLKMQRSFMMIDAAQDYVQQTSGIFRSEMEGDQTERQSRGAVVDQALDDYSTSVDNLSRLLKGL